MSTPNDPTATDPAATSTFDVVVCGAHLSGMPLNHQLVQRGGALIAATQSAPCYQLWLIADAPPLKRPAMVRVAHAGAAIPVEIWRLSAQGFAEFVQLIPAPLGIGKVLLADGTQCCGFIAEAIALDGATDISHFGGWRAYMQSLG